MPLPFGWRERCGGRRARIALRGFVALRATRFLGSHDSCGAREACKIRLRARNFSSVIAYARYYFVIDANKVPLQCGQEARQTTFKRSPHLFTHSADSHLRGSAPELSTATHVAPLPSDYAAPTRLRSADAAAAAQMAPPTRRRRPATCFLLALLAQRAATFAPRPRLAAPRARHILYSSSKPLPDANIPGLTRDKDDLPGDEQPEEDAAAVEILETATETVEEAPAVEADQYADIRERIKARAAELDLKATKPKEVFEATEQKNVLQSMVDTAVEETQKEEEALAYSDGLGVVEGMKKELDLIIWPGPQEVLNTLGLVVVITAVMVIYVLGVDKFLQFALDPLFHYPAKEVIAEKAAKAAAQAASAAAAGAGL